MANSEGPVTSAPWTFLVPGDPNQRTGGYGYVREVVKALQHLGQPVRLQGLEGSFPDPDDQALAAMDKALAELPPGSVVVLDGLAMGGMPSTIARHRHRLRLVALVHHPLADEAGLEPDVRQRLFELEREALAQVAGVITTSRTTAAGLARYEVAPAMIRAVPPGVHRPAMVPARLGPSDRPLRILCVGTLSERKAQHQLVESLAALSGSQWQCVMVGSDQRQPDYARRLREQIRDSGLEDRIRLTGELGEAALAEHWRWADVMVLPSLYEGYGMVIDEALNEGLPVVTTDGGALAETGRRPGVLQYPAGDSQALRQHLARLMMDPDHYEDLVEGARLANAALTSWQEVAADFRQAVTELMAQAPSPASQFDSDWLSLREPADHAARPRSLALEAADWLKRRGQSGQSRERLQVVDIGCGTGSNLRYLAPILPQDVHWILVDQDATLLARARENAHRLPPGLRVDYQQRRLRQDNLATMLPANPDLVTASALLDLVTRPWLVALADYLSQARAGALMALTYAGQFSFDHPDPDDDWVRAQINAHQQGNKGEGAALGPAAAGELATLLAARGYQVQLADSPWQLPPSQSMLQSQLLAGWRDAALEQAPGSRVRIRDWAQWRQKWIDRGESVIRVQHTDLLALPPEPQAG